MRYNPRMDNDHWSRDEWFKTYETGVWVFLIIAAAAFLGLILWMGYAILCERVPWAKADALLLLARFQRFEIAVQ